MRLTDAIPDEIMREATLVAVDMEIHAALSTTTRAKAEVIAKALMARDKRARSPRARVRAKAGTGESGAGTVCARGQQTDT